MKMPISSHHSLPDPKMRVLIVSAFVAFAAAAPAPSHILALPVAYSAVAIPGVVPTISPGDIQAAAIDAHVKAEDLARAAADKAREFNEQATENIDEKSVTSADMVKEKSGEALWSAEDKKWQAIDSLKTAEAQIDGIVANNAAALAKSAVGGLVPYVAAVSPFVGPVSPIVYSSGIVAPGFNSVVSQSLAKTTEVKDEKSEASVKTAEPEKPAEAEKTEKADAASEAVVKSAQLSVNEQPEVPLGQTVVSPYGFSNVYRYDVVGPAISPLFAQPLVKFASVQQLPGVVAPTLLKTVC